MSVRLAVLASGGGSNLQAILDRFATMEHVRCALVVSDRARAGALRRAEAANVPALHVPADAGSDAALLAALDEHRIDLIAERYRGRILNIHPALLPAFGGAGMYGMRVHEAVLAAGCRITGATVHHVDERYDEGRIIAQWPVPVLPDDTAETLAARVLRVEHRLYPAVIDMVAHHMRGEPVSIATSSDEFRLANNDSEADIMALARI